MMQEALFLDLFEMGFWGPFFYLYVWADYSQ